MTKRRVLPLRPTLLAALILVGCGGSVTSRPDAGSVADRPVLADSKVGSDTKPLTDTKLIPDAVTSGDLAAKDDGNVAVDSEIDAGTLAVDLGSAMDENAGNVEDVGNVADGSVADGPLVAAPPLVEPVVTKFIHPSVPVTLAELAVLKAKIQAGEWPWKDAYDAMAADWISALDYQPRRAKDTVGRNPNVNLEAFWRPDMNAAFNQARMWYFTGNEVYAKKARYILLDWARTQTAFTGMESNLDLGDYAFKFVGAAEILRGTWPQWTADDTATVQKLFANVYWPCLGLDGGVIGPTNKGSLSLAAGAAIAVFCDDQAKLDRVLYHLRYTASTGFGNTLSNGEHGETARDQGHSYNHLLAMSFVANVLWNQGIDVFSYADNRLLAMVEYYSRDNLSLPISYVPMGTTDYYYTASNGDTRGFAPNSTVANLLHNAYVTRKGLAAPYMDRLFDRQSQNPDSFMYLKTSDDSTATPIPEAKLPWYSAMGTGLLDKDLGVAAPAGSSSYSDGIWTVKGAGLDIWTQEDESAHLTYVTVTGDATAIAKVESVENTEGHVKAGVAIRAGLEARPSAKEWIAVTPQPTVEGYMGGWTNVYGGSNWEKESRGISQGPYWLKVERVGKMIVAFASPDGTSWAPIVQGEFSNMPETVYIGLIVTSFTNQKLNTFTFSHVSVTGGAGGATVKPEAPLSLLASPSKQVQLRWTQSFGATNYSVKRATVKGGPYTTVGTGITNPSYVDTTVAADTTYHYVVTATNAAGESPVSMEDTVTTPKP